MTSFEIWQEYVRQREIELKARPPKFKVRFITHKNAPMFDYWEVRDMRRFMLIAKKPTWREAIDIAVGMAYAK